MVRGDWGCSLLPHLSNDYCAVAHIDTGTKGGSSFYIVLAYFKYQDEMDVHLVHLDMVLDELAHQPLLLGIDSNTHSSMWHCEAGQSTGRGHREDHKRMCMEGFILKRSLKLLNTYGQRPIYSTINGESNNDFTLVMDCGAPSGLFTMTAA